jgi:hypothetical protein
MTKENFHYQQEGVAMTCRSFQEYKDMFVLDDELLASGRILDVAGGASSFTAEGKRKGFLTTAVDPSYSLPFEEMTHRGKLEIEESTQKIEKMKDLFVWDYYGDASQHADRRQLSLQLMLNDYKKEDARNRYVPGVLPSLPFSNDSFRLILCSHFLFLYEEQFDLEFHIQAIQELIRICQSGGGIRIFPLINLKGKTYSHLAELIEKLQTIRLQNLNAEIKQLVEIKQIHTDFRFLPDAVTVLSIERN